MHLLVACHDLYPDPGSGGSGRYVYETSRRLVDRGHEVSVVTRLRGDVEERERVAGIDVFRCEVTIADHPATYVLPRLPLAFDTVADHVHDFDPDVVSFQGPVLPLFLHALLDPSVPRSCTFHSPWPAEYRLRTSVNGASPLRQWWNAEIRSVLEGYLLTRVQDVVTLSAYMRDELLARHTPGAPVAVIPGGVDAERFRPDAGPFDRIDADGPAFLTVRRLSPRMGHDRLLEAFAMVLERHPDAELYIAGDGPLRAALQRGTASLGIAERTTFLGYVPDEDLPAAYATADLFVLPTTALEGFGLATLEALASATPVVATPVGGSVELLARVQTAAEVPEPLLVDDPSAESLAARMNAWTDLPASERVAAGLRCRRAVVRHYSWEQTVDALEKRYRSLTGETTTAESVRGE
jgi:glycosyltransferase involved in cell wall biosynthesis